MDHSNYIQTSARKLEISNNDKERANMNTMTKKMLIAKRDEIKANLNAGNRHQRRAASAVLVKLNKEIKRRK